METQCHSHKMPFNETYGLSHAFLCALWLDTRACIKNEFSQLQLMLAYVYHCICNYKGRRMHQGGNWRGWCREALQNGYELAQDIGTGGKSSSFCFTLVTRFKSTL